MGAMVAACVGCVLLPAASRAAPDPAPAVCLQAYRIASTDVPDDSTILFTMQDRSVYRAKLVSPCVGLRLDPRGFTYEPTPGTNEICSNLLTIRTNTTHQVCLVGPIEKIANGRK